MNLKNSYTLNIGQMDALIDAILGEPGDRDAELRALAALVALGVITPCDGDGHDRGELGCDRCRPYRAGWKRGPM